MAAQAQQAVVRFGVFQVNLRSGELLKHGLKIRVSGQPFKILVILLEHSGEVVTREELQKNLWPDDTFVDFEHSLNSAIKKLRTVLDRLHKVSVVSGQRKARSQAERRIELSRDGTRAPTQRPE